MSTDETFVGSFQGLITQWVHMIFTLHADGYHAQAMRYCVTFVQMQDKEIQDQLSEEMQQMRKYLHKYRLHRGVDIVQDSVSKAILDESEGFNILSAILPKLSIILHENGFFSRQSQFEVRSTSKDGITDYRSKRRP